MIENWIKGFLILLHFKGHVKNLDDSSRPHSLADDIESDMKYIKSRLFRLFGGVLSQFQHALSGVGGLGAVRVGILPEVQKA